MVEVVEQAQTSNLASRPNAKTLTFGSEYMMGSPQYTT